ncbi:MAG: tetratricopeptide repeat protein [Chlorobi bacterium]|nr:tetratricopeptide repeat protein [Chlorobiota bacterium]
MKLQKFLLSMTGLFLVTGLVIFGQTQKDVIDAYNEGVKLISSDTKGALAAFEKCVSLAEQVGDEAKETKDLAITQIPGLYYKLALDEYKKKNLDGAIDGFKKTKEVAEKYGDRKIAGKCANIIPKLYYTRGTGNYKKKNYEEALGDFNEAIALTKSYAKPYLGKALVYDKMGDFAKMKVAADKAVEVGLISHDTKTVNSTERFMQTGAFNRAIKAIQGNNLTQAEEYLRYSIEYGNDSPEVYYQLGKIYQSKKEWSKAEENVQKALTLDKGMDNVKAKYYFILGEIYEAQSKKSEACSAFRKALFPPYDERAKYEIEQVLKCQ